MTIAFVFDMDDTLYPEYHYVCSGFEAVGSHIHDVCGVTHFAEVCLVYFHKGIRQHIFDHALKDCGVAEKFKVSDLVKIYRGHTPNIQLYPDAIEVLEEISRRQNAHIALITDGYLEVQKRKFSVLKLQKYFLGSVIFTDEYGRENWKPSTFAFPLTQKNLPATVKKFVYIGDNLNKDFYAPNLLGWDSVRIARNSEYDIYSESDRIIPTAFQPQQVIDNLSALLQRY